MDVPNASDILLNYEYMDPIRMAYTTHDVASSQITNIISLNVDYIEEYRKMFGDEIIPHELAHVICFNNCTGESDHGDMWNRLCISMGGTGDEFINTENRI